MVPMKVTGNSVTEIVSEDLLNICCIQSAKLGPDKMRKDSGKEKRGENNSLFTILSSKQK